QERDERLGDRLGGRDADDAAAARGHHGELETGEEQRALQAVALERFGRGERDPELGELLGGRGYQLNLGTERFVQGGVEPDLAEAQRQRIAREEKAQDEPQAIGS